MDGKIKKGDMVEYLSVAGLIHVEVLKVKPDGKLILDTRSKNKLQKDNGRRKKGDLVDCQKMCVLCHIGLKKLKFENTQRVPTLFVCKKRPFVVYYGGVKAPFLFRKLTSLGEYNFQTL